MCISYDALILTYINFKAWNYFTITGAAKDVGTTSEQLFCTNKLKKKKKKRPTSLSD